MRAESQKDIVHIPGICGGIATVRGTRIAVGLLAKYRLMGVTAEELCSDKYYPHLTLEGVNEAFRYADEHTEEIKRDIKRF